MARARRAAVLAASLAVTAQAATPNTFEIVGNSGVSAQQLFLSTAGKVVIVDKTEGNGNNLNIDGHPAWGSEYDLSSNSVRAMDVVSNSFCAGGNVLGNGTWLNVGGNQAVTYGGLPGTAGYSDADGGRAIRTFTPCDDGNCDWADDITGMTTRRWYPTLETLEDGSIIIIGGCDYGGYVNDAGQNNPTIEYYPSRGSPIGLNLLTTTLPANLFALTWLLPSGNIFINANLGNEIFDYKNNVEHPLPDMPHAVRTYPGSAATAMLPLTPANNYTATLLFCGGTNLQPDQWVLTWNIAAYPADSTCVSITPDVSTTFVDEEPLPENRVMGNFIGLPDGRFLLLNGIATGTAGYGNTSWAVGQSFGDNPVYEPAYYDPLLPSGSRFYRSGMGNSTVPRMYHSSATLLPDGSVFSSGSNPNADYIANGTAGYKWVTEYRVEKYYPDYYNEPRPAPTGLPTTLSYGGASFDLGLSSSDIGSDSSVLSDARVMVIRTGFSTHAMNMGQRVVQLNSTATYTSSSNTATLHVNQLPPNPALLVPGPAMIFVTINGVPSIGQFVMVGNGQIGTQSTAAQADLPANSGFTMTSASSSSASATVDQAGSKAKSGAVASYQSFGLATLLASFIAFCIAAL